MWISEKTEALFRWIGIVGFALMAGSVAWSGNAHAAWWSILPSAPVLVPEAVDPGSSAECAPQLPGAQATYLPACADDGGVLGASCSMFDGETMSTGFDVGSRPPVAVQLSAKETFGEHRYWAVSVTDYPADPLDADPQSPCFDVSVPGDLEPRVNFDSVYSGGCTAPAGTVWVNVRPIGGAWDCGVDRRCTTVIYGP